MKARADLGGGGRGPRGRPRHKERLANKRRGGKLLLVNRTPSPKGNHAAVVEHYARLAPKYDGRWDRYTRRTLAAVAERIDFNGSRPQRILDVACGTGRLTEMIRLLDAEGAVHVTGFDLSPQMIEMARQRMAEAPGVQWGVAPAEDLPVPDASFDVVTCANAFHLVTDADKALAEFRRVLKPGGRLIILDWCREYSAMAVVLVASRLFGRQYRRIETVEELSRRLEAADFDVLGADKLKATWFWGTMCVVAEKRGHPQAAGAPA
jgi:ubiquinone/menaquinone biosynthesis C-methylase UbiE